MFENLTRICRNPKQWLRWKYELSGKKRRCNMCGGTFRKFHPYLDGMNSVPTFLKVLKIVGSDVDNFSCPYCDCYDRERHLVMYFDQLNIWNKVEGGKVLHIAPEKHLSMRIESACPSLSIKGDLYPAFPDIQKVDITETTFQDNYFDVIICNHVLEHVLDDIKAMRELCRILKPEGVAILQTPYSPILKESICDSGINTDELREQIYGQHDHIRVYGVDLFERLELAGFNVERVCHEDVLKDIDSTIYGVNNNEKLILCHKA